MGRKKKQQDWQTEPIEGAAERRLQRENKLLEAVGYRKVKISDDLERQADEILRKADHDMLEAIAANVQTLCDGFAQLKLPSNDPEYLKTLQATETRRSEIANKIATIHIVPDKQETWIGVSVNNRKNQAEAIEVARQMGEHFEAKVIRHDEEPKP